MITEIIISLLRGALRPLQRALLLPIRGSSALALVSTAGSTALLNRIEPLTCSGCGAQAARCSCFSSIWNERKELGNLD